MGCGVSRRPAGWSELDNHVFFDGYTRDGTARLRKHPHSNALKSPYPASDVIRYPLTMGSPEVDWVTPLPKYAPLDYTSEVVLKMPLWADTPDRQHITFNRFDTDSGVNRKSHEGEYKIDTKTNTPLNPRGRTGLRGRGLLGRWGPNHVAQAVITTWGRDEEGNMTYGPDGDPILYVFAIRSKGSTEWSIPGCVIDPKESVSLSLKREFQNVVATATAMSQEERDDFETWVDNDGAFSRGVDVYLGYADDARNTDNAWVETTCINFHFPFMHSAIFRFDSCPSGSAHWVRDLVRALEMELGEHTKDMMWAQFGTGVKMCATQAEILKIVNRMRQSWHRFLT